MKLLKRLWLLATLLSSQLVHALPVKVELQLNQLSVYDYTTATYLNPIAPGGLMSLTFDTDKSSVTDYGNTTITTFGDVLGTKWSSPLTALIPGSPSAGDYGIFYNSYTFPNVSDYPAQFIEEAAAQANTYRFSGSIYHVYHIEVRATRRSDPRNGDGTSDYSFSSAQLIDFYRSFLLSGEPVYFNESYAIYSMASGVPVYSAGVSWTSYSAIVTGVEASPVSEPSGGILFMTSLAVLFLSASRLRHSRWI